tara:strand:- start:344 stop:607 length:264 start_codon:yes stop_codon:yes gene_type:complete
MGYCKFCESKPVENWFGNWCSECRQIKNLCNVYGYERVLEILKKCCIRNENQLEKKIIAHKEKLPTITEEGDDSYEKPKTRKSVKFK